MKPTQTVSTTQQTSTHSTTKQAGLRTNTGTRAGGVR
jgi:hypothetical protein